MNPSPAGVGGAVVPAMAAVGLLGAAARAAWLWRPSTDGIAFSEEHSEEAVISTMAGIPDGARSRVVAEALIRNLHRFVKDVEPTNEEWESAMAFLVKLGQWSAEPEKRHELMLVSDTLGVTMLVDCNDTTDSSINHRRSDPRATEWTVQGPFHGAHAECENGANICLDGSDKPGGDATPALVSGRVLDCVTGAPIPGAKVDIWLTASDGEYAVQRDNVSPRNLCGIFHTAADGAFSFKCIRPTEYKVPEDGPGGDLLRYCARHPWRPAHIHFVITASGYEKVTTHLFCRGDRYLYEDAVFAVIDSLILDWPELHDREEAQRLGFQKLPYCKVHHDFKLAPTKA